MKKLSKLKTAIGFMQDDAFFITFIDEIATRGLITVNEGDIKQTKNGYTVSDSFYSRLCGLYGVEVG